LEIFISNHYSFEQACTVKNGVVVATNLLTHIQTISAAVHLTFGMGEESARWFLATNKVYCAISTRTLAVNWAPNRV